MTGAMPAVWSAPEAERGMALVFSLVFLVLLTLIGLSSLHSATLQEKMAASLSLRNQSFQAAEAALRVGEGAVHRGAGTWAVCSSTENCAAPAEAQVAVSAGFNAGSGVTWVATANGFYGVQNLGSVQNVIRVPSTVAVTLYRVTAVGLAGHSRSVLESIYARY